MAAQSVPPPSPPPERAATRRAAVGDTLRRAYRDALKEPVPDEFLQLLDRLA